VRTLDALVDETGVRLPAHVQGVLTVCFDERYVWSFQPARDGVADAGGRKVPWPAALRPHLTGTTRVTVADHHTDRVHVDDQVVFAGSTEQLRLEDAHGHPLAVNKVGNLTRVFAETDGAARREILEGTARVLSDLREHGDVPAYLCYGCLLGAVREGRMIGTDCDADVCYLSERTAPVDVVSESYRLERTMRAQGWRTVRMSGGDFKVLLRLADGRTCYVDVFAGFYVEGVFYQLGNRSGRLRREAVVPTTTVLLEGVELPAPADPEAMLEFVYGPTWLVPDPAFRFADRPEGVRRLDGWLRGWRDDLPAWNAFHRGRDAARVPRRRSDFAPWVARRISGGDLVADVGCGAGRDAAFFARRGHRVLAYDASPDARRAAQRRLQRAANGSEARRLVLGELRTAVLAGAEVALAGPGARHVYARHLVQWLDEEERRNLWRLARTALRGGPGWLFLEIATGPEAVSPAAVVEELDAAGGRVLHRADGPGTDLFDDPARTCRLQVAFDPLPRSTT
jgi:SAM-dependent methyltransferase